MIPGSDSDHPSFLKSFLFAVQGFRFAVRSERNIKVMLCGGALAVVAGLVLQLDLLSWGIIFLCCGVVISAELVNTAIETVVDLVSPEFHPLAGRAKDIAAAAVWVLSLMVALVGLAVADDAEHVAVTAIDLVAQSGAGGGGGALAQRAGGQIHAGGQLPVGVAGELGVRMVEGISFLHGIVAHQAKSGVSHGARVALGQDQPIPILPPGVLRVKLHNLSVQDGHQVRQVHGAAHVAEAPGVDDLQRFQPDLSRQNFALFFVHGVFLPFLHLNCTPRGNLRRIGSTGGQVAEK